MKFKERHVQVFNALKFLSTKSQLNNKWIAASVILSLLRSEHCPTHIFNNEMKRTITLESLNKLTNARPYYFMKVLTHSNPYGIFKQQYRPPQSTQYQQFYYLSSILTLPPPPCNIYEQLIIDDINCLRMCTRSNKEHRQDNSIQHVSSKVSKEQRTTQEKNTTTLPATVDFIHQSHPEQLQHPNEVVIGMTCNEQVNTNESNIQSNNESNNESNNKSTNTNTTRACPPSASPTELPSTNLNPNKEKEHISIDDNGVPYHHRSKWYSPEARCLFFPSPTPSELDSLNIDQGTFIKQVLRSKLKLLIIAHQTMEGWKDLIGQGNNNVTLEDINVSYVFKIQRQSKYLAHATNELLKNYHNSNLSTIYSNVASTIHRQEYFDEVEDDVFDNSTPVHESTIAKLMRKFISNNFTFELPFSKRNKFDLPQIFLDNNDLLTGFNNFCSDNHHTLSAELAQDYLINIGIPALIESIKILNPHVTLLSVADVLSYYRIRYLCTRTVCKWMNKLGYSYCERKKCYYNDNHEKKEYIEYRNSFVKSYLDDLEINCHRYVQLTFARYQALVKEQKLHPNMKGHSYVNDQGVPMIEFHVDDHLFLQNVQSELLFGASLSVRKPTSCKPLIIFGQDECIFKQFKFTKKTWRLPDGRYPLLPKDEGAGLMVSAFVSREFGFGLKLTNSQLTVVNNKRSSEFYIDSAAAIMRIGTDKKPKLTSSPFVKFLQYGVNNDGYWSYEDMILQLEDCVDCLLTLFPHFEYYFLFDHSNGHDRMKPDGLCINKCNKNFGGCQPRMRESKVTHENIGNFPATNKIRAGEKQSMQFSDTDVGPFYLTVEQREQRRYDTKIGTKEIPLSKDELTKNLKEVGIQNPPGTKDKLQKLSILNNLPTKKTVDKIQEGWVNKQKGCLQILYERGWIDESKISQYTMYGKKDIYGKTIPNTSLIEMLKLQTDFANEETLIESYSRTLGVRSGKSPPGHPEVAGEGIEFVWGAGKVCFRFHPLKDKKTKDDFINLVHYCLSDEVLSVDRVRSFARRARQYMLAYRSISEQIDVADDDDKKENKMSHALIEKCVKLFRKRKTHRSAVDFDNGFIKGVMEKMEGTE
jgi:hypothetical protein